MKRKLFLIIVLILLISISGCGGKKDVKKSLEEIRTGTEGISVSFLPNNPPATIHVENDNTPFDVILELKNKGAYPQPDEQDFYVNVYLSGYDKNILELDVERNDVNRLKTSLIGKSLVNIGGGSDIVTFKGKVKSSQLNVEKYEPILLATACYKYSTTAEPSVCIEPDPYSTLTQKKVCEVKDISLSGQGAPIAVTKINEESFKEKTQFKLTIKNVGNGDVIKEQSIKKCDPFGKAENDKIGREDLDKVYLERVTIGGLPLDCSPFAEDSVRSTQGIIRLVNGEGYIVCDLQKEGYDAYKESKTAFTTPLKITLSYGYRTIAQRSLQIKKEMSGNN